MKNNSLGLVAMGAFLTALPSLAADLQLKYAVIVTRHGIRSPTWEPARLDEYSARTWPDFGVPPGNLTPHGRGAIQLMGAYYRDWLSSQKLIHAGCEDAKRVFIYADKDQRTVETARALSESLLPGCSVDMASNPGSTPDPLFAGTFKPDPQLAVRAVDERLEPQLLDHHLAAFNALQSILGSATRKLIDPLGDVVRGTFATGSTLSEDLFLEYTNGMKDPGWGRLNERNLLQILEIHAVYADLMRRTPYLARRGSNLLAAILRSIAQAESGAASGALGHPGDALLVISGHDTNLSNLSGLLGLHWRLRGYQPDDTPPGGALIFSLWRDASGEDFIKLRYVAQTPNQMRNLAAEAPLIQDVGIPGCDPCRFDAFKALVEPLTKNSTQDLR